MELKFKDNKAKTTILFIHGYYGSSDSIKKLLNLKLNCNIVYFDFPDDKIFNNQEIAREIDKMVKLIKGPVVIMGHSLGGAISTHLRDKFKIKKYIFLSALTPIMAENKGIKFLAKQGVASRTIKNIMSKSLSFIGRDNISAFIDPPRKWSKFATDNIINTKYLDIELRKNYLGKAHKSISIIGEDDSLFNYKDYNEFMEDTNIKTYTIKEAGHSIINDAALEIAQILNKEIVFHKRWRKKILKSA